MNVPCERSSTETSGLTVLPRPTVPPSTKHGLPYLTRQKMWTWRYGLLHHSALYLATRYEVEILEFLLWFQ